MSLISDSALNLSCSSHYMESRLHSINYATQHKCKINWYNSCFCFTTQITIHKYVHLSAFVWCSFARTYHSYKYIYLRITKIKKNVILNNSLFVPLNISKLKKCNCNNNFLNSTILTFYKLRIKLPSKYLHEKKIPHGYEGFFPWLMHTFHILMQSLKILVCSDD